MVGSPNFLLYTSNFLLFCLYTLKIVIFCQKYVFIQNKKCEITLICKRFGEIVCDIKKKCYLCTRNGEKLVVRPLWLNISCNWNSHLVVKTGWLIFYIPSDYLNVSSMKKRSGFIRFIWNKSRKYYCASYQKNQKNLFLLLFLLLNYQ